MRKNFAFFAQSYTDRQLIRMIIFEMAGTLVISLGISAILLALLRIGNTAMFSIELTPFFLFATLALLLFTLSVSVSIPIIRILKIRPAEVIS